MRFSTRPQPYVCLPCRMVTGRRVLATEAPPFVTLSQRRRFHKAVSATESIHHATSESSATFTSGFSQVIEPLEGRDVGRQDKLSTGSQDTHRLPLRRINARGKFSSGTVPPSDSASRHALRHFATSTVSTLELSQAQQEELREAHALRQRLSAGLNSVASIKKDSESSEGVQIDQLLKTLPQAGRTPVQQKFIQRLGTEFKGKSAGSVAHDLDLAASHAEPSRNKVTDPKAKEVLTRLGVIRNVASPSKTTSPSLEKGKQDKRIPNESSTKRRRPLASLITPLPPSKRSNNVPTASKKQQVAWTGAESHSVEAQNLELSSLDLGNTVDLPQLSFDLPRVLFNPGYVYQLQDPRSRVYNFDPYLEKIMPISEFNFEALNPYLTSSEDKQLIRYAQECKKRYIGSSSSMTSALSQFHFLLSQWRELNIENLTRGFIDPSRTLTILSRSAAAIFLRYRDGVYAVDADKEYDEPNILMSLGKSMEKLLTLEKEDFEKWRRTNAGADKKSLDEKPDSFHYSQQGRFLLRSQLDAYDPRLPGTGYFDLKTRAVAGIRFNIKEHEAGMGYEIKGRQGNWESYEREYYDMMRSVFLKYSLQARMGHMDGIFVAFHNTSRIFGFQYIPISEMDVALHGQHDPSLGDQEFRLSIHLMEEIFNLGTQAYPKQSLRIHFDTREASATEEKPFMNIFIEPMAEDDIKAIQTSQKAQFEAFEKKMLRGEDPMPLLETENDGDAEAKEDKTAQPDTTLPINSIQSQPTGPASNAANIDYLDSILNTPRARTSAAAVDKEVIALKLTVQNKVNGRLVPRVQELTPSAKWTMDYKLERRGDEEGKRMYRMCKNRRMSALKMAINRGSDDPFIRSLRAMSERGAEWRKQQDELDAQRERVILYEDRVTK